MQIQTMVYTQGERLEFQHRKTHVPLAQTLYISQLLQLSNLASAESTILVMKILLVYNGIDIW
jgi:hypothetical protein